MNDLFVKRFLAVCLGVSMLLSSAALLIYTVGNVQAAEQKPLPNMPASMAGYGGFGLGVHEGFVYYGYTGEDGVYIYRVSLKSDKIRGWE